MRRVLLAAAAALALGGTAVHAQDYPTRSIVVVVPFSAGGPTDTVTRLVTDVMSRELGQQIVVENVSGAGGTLGAGRVAKAEPDGYTLLLHHIGQATSATLYRKLPYDPRTAFAPIGLVTEVPMTFVARGDFEPNTMAEYISYLKENKDTVTYANAGIGSASHLCGMLLQSTLGIKLTTVPYKGTGPAMTDILGGQVDTMCDQTTNTTNQIKEKKIKAYAVTTKTKVASLPDLPTADSSGLEGFEVAVWHGLYAPAGTPEPIVAKLNAALQVALKDEKVVERFAQLGTAPVDESRASPEVLQKWLGAEIDRWAPIIKAAGVYAN